MTTAPLRSADVLVNMVNGSDALKQEIQADPIKALTNLAQQVTTALPPPAYISDKFIYRIVVSALGLISLFALIGAIVLSLYKVAVPDILTALGAASIGALAGLLAPSPGNK